MRINGRKNINTPSKLHDYWQSYSDMMAALLLMFILIMSLALSQVNSQATELQTQKEQLRKLLGVKPEIVADLKKELSEFDVNIDEKTGDILFKSDILFDYNQTILKEAGSSFLGQFMPKYLGVILSEKYLPYIAEIIIEGHTDNIGGYAFNLKLSQDRALTVAEYCIGDNNPFVTGEQLDQLRKIITVNGRAYTNPIYTDDTKMVIDQDKSRRVEVKFRLKDDETIEELKQILGQ